MLPAVQDRHLPAIRPLTARSVVLSTLLGYHPPALPVRALVRVGGLFGMAEQTVRVALTRMVATGDVTADEGVYQLSSRLVQRQAEQEEGCSPRLKAWDGRWEMAVVTTASRSLPDRVALRKAMAALRLAEFREGVWIRPDNLVREPGVLFRPGGNLVANQCTFFDSRPAVEPAMLASSLWELDEWAAEAVRLRRELDAAASLKDGFIVIAEALRHLLIDPCLPAELLPANWPGTELRARYAEFRTDYAEQLRDYSQG
jgi:phenylacetic acid degradation operon negative regulatory protein